MSSPKSIEGQKVVLVTGCSSGGIGFALCEEFAQQGCIVYATARRLDRLEGFTSPSIRKHKLDVTDGDNIESVTKAILAEAGKIDIVINNAGAIAVGPIAEVTIDQVRKAFELNTFGALRVTQAVLPSMFERKQGLIVNIGSVAGHITTPWNSLYSAAKAALHSITDGLAMECKPFGVKVMLVAPGGVKSRIAANQTASLKFSPTTVYKRYESRIIERTNTSQGPGTMDTKEFAKRVVKQALRASPPSYMSLGHLSVLFYLLQWLPRQWVLAAMYKSLVG